MKTIEPNTIADASAPPVVIVDETFHDTVIVNTFTDEVRRPVRGMPLVLEPGDVLATEVPAASDPAGRDRTATAGEPWTPGSKPQIEKSFATIRREIKRLAQVKALDAAGVPNGHRAIAAWLAANWQGPLQDTHGPHDPVATISRWRFATAQPRDRSRAKEAIRRLRRARQSCRDSAFSRRPRAWLPGAPVRRAA